MTEVVFHCDFRKKLRKLDPKIIKAFKARLKIFEINKFDPILKNHSVEKRFPGCRSINITGNYRVIFEDLGAVAIFLKIGTHPELYG